MDHLQEFRLRGIQTLAVLCWLCVAMSGLDALLNSGDVLGFGFSVVLALGPTWLAVRGRSDAAARITVGATLPLFAAVFLMQAHQQAWQTDVHMVFFALIAAVAILADWRPLIAATLILPGESDPLNDPELIRERLEHQVGAVIDAGACMLAPTTVVDMSGDEPALLRRGQGDPAVLGL